MTLFAACPNSLSVIKASFRAAKRNNAPIYFATTLNQVDNDGGYTGMTQAEFTKILAREAAAVHYTGPYVVAMPYGPKETDFYGIVPYVLVGQLLGFYASKAHGLNPDAPSVSGNIHRVVEGVTIYE